MEWFLWVKFKKMLVFSMKSPNSACTGSAPYPQQHCSKLNANYYEWVTPWLVMYSLKSKVIGLEFTHSLQVTHTLKIHTLMLLCRGESTASILLIQGAGTFEFLKLLFSFALAYCRLWPWGDGAAQCSFVCYKLYNTLFN